MKFFRNLLLLAVAVLGLTPLIWFWGRGEALINGVDTNFPLDPAIWFERRLYVWDAVANAGRDFSSSVAGLFFHLIQLIPYQLGANLQTVQIISLIFWFTLLVFSAYFLAKIILPRKPIVQLLFVVLYSFNIYLFNTWENVKVANLALVSAIPLALGILILLKEGGLSWRRAAFYCVLVGIVLSGAGINASYFLTFFLLLAIYVFAEILMQFTKQFALARIGDFLLLSAFILLINSVWIWPTASFLLRDISPFGTLGQLGFTNWVDSLSENTSILNVLREQGAWDWYATEALSGLPLYIPYALNYFHRLPFLLFSFTLPALALLSLFLREKSKNSLYFSFALMLLVGVLLGAGTHEPTGVIFRWLAQKVPFFTLFRSPWYVFTPFVTLGISGLIGLLFWRLDDLVRKSAPSLLGRHFVSLLALFLIVGNFFYSYPLISGKIFRPDRSDGFYIQFPDYIFEARTWLAENENRGRVIGYPDDEIENFSWGYRGIESILQLLTENETLFLPFYGQNAPVAFSLREFYANLKKGELAAAENLAAKLGVGLLFEKKDQASLAPALPAEIGKLPSECFNQWCFHEFPKEPLPKIFSADKTIFAYPFLPFDQGAKLLSLIDKPVILLNPGDTVVNQVPEISQMAGLAVLAENSQFEDFTDVTYAPAELGKRLAERDPSRVSFSFKIPSDGTYNPVLERYKLEEFGINPGLPLAIELDGQPTVFLPTRISDSFVYFEPVRLSVGEHKVSLNLTNQNLVRGGDFDFSAFTSEGEGEFALVSEERGPYLNIFNKGDHDIAAIFAVDSFNPLISYLVQLKYRQIYGNNASVVLRQYSQKTAFKTQVERMPNYPEWHSFSFYYEPVKTDSRLRVELVAPATDDPLGTKVFYDELAIFRVFTNNLVFVKEGSPNFLATPTVEFKKVSPVEYQAQVTGASGPHLLIFSENYSPEWEITALDSDGKEFSPKPLHFSANLFANAWYFPQTPKDYQVKIFYRRQRLFQAGAASSLATLLGTFLLFLSEKRRRTK